MKKFRCSCFSPSQLICPGDTLRETLKHHKITQTYLAERLGISEKHLSHIITGKARIMPEIAIKIAEVIPPYCPHFWINLQGNYDLETLRLESYE